MWASRFICLWPLRPFRHTFAVHFPRAFPVTDLDLLSRMTRRQLLALAGATGAATLLSRHLSALSTAVPPSSPLRINGPRRNEHLSALSAFGRNPQGGVTRLA